MNNKKIFLGLSAGLIIAGLAFTAIFSFLYRSKTLTAHTVSDDITQLIKIFTKINAECGIISFDYQQNPINFLNVGSFTSSEVGPMNLAHADKWQGPYVQDNFQIQGKEYMVVRTKKGYFITPGNGVKLPNGKIVGIDIILNEDADIARMMQDPNALQIEGRALAVPLSLAMPQSYPDIWNIAD